MFIMTATGTLVCLSIHKKFFSLWPPYVRGQTVIFFPCGFFFFFFSPNLSSRRLDVYHTSSHGVAGPSVNLECRSETCCARLAGNAGLKKSPKCHHLGSIAQLCRAISSQLRHVSTIGKKVVKQRYVLHMSS